MLMLGLDAMNDDPTPAEPDWNDYRARVRGRSQRQFSAVIASVIFVVAVFVVVVRVLAPQDYPVGDFRNDPLFRLGFGGFLLILSGRCWSRPSAGFGATPNGRFARPRPASTARS